jgi:hypothetical protein
LTQCPDVVSDFFMGEVCKESRRLIGVGQQEMSKSDFNGAISCFYEALLEKA